MPGDIKTSGGQSLLDLQGLAIVILGLLQLTAAKDQLAKIVETVGGIEASWRQSLLYLQALAIVLLSLDPVSALVCRHPQVAEAGSDSKASGCELLANLQPFALVLIRPGQIASQHNHKSEIVKVVGNRKASWSQFPRSLRAPWADTPLHTLTGVRMDVCAFYGVAPLGPARVPIVNEKWPDTVPCMEPGRPLNLTQAYAVESFTEYQTLWRV